MSSARITAVLNMDLVDQVSDTRGHHGSISLNKLIIVIDEYLHNDPHVRAELYEAYHLKRMKRAE